MVDVRKYLNNYLALRSGNDFCNVLLICSVVLMFSLVFPQLINQNLVWIDKNFVLNVKHYGNIVFAFALIVLMFDEIVGCFSEKKYRDFVLFLCFLMTLYIGSKSIYFVKLCLIIYFAKHCSFNRFLKSYLLLVAGVLFVWLVAYNFDLLKEVKSVKFGQNISTWGFGHFNTFSEIFLPALIIGMYFCRKTLAWLCLILLIVCTYVSWRYFYCRTGMFIGCFALFSWTVVCIWNHINLSVKARRLVVAMIPWLMVGLTYVLGYLLVNQYFSVDGAFDCRFREIISIPQQYGLSFFKRNFHQWIFMDNLYVRFICSYGLLSAGLFFGALCLTGWRVAVNARVMACFLCLCCYALMESHNVIYSFVLMFCLSFHREEF